MAGLFNSYYYGKAGKADFTPEQLPTNRVTLFFEMLRIRLGGIIGMNLVYVLTALPMLFWSFLTLQVLQLGISIDEAGNVLASAADVTSTTGTLMTYFTILIPCMVFSYVFRPGIAYILRNWARDQHTFTMSDFKDAVKGNWKNGLLLGLANGLSLLLAYVAYFYYGMMASAGNTLWVVPQVLIVICLAVWWMANMLIPYMMVTYEMNFRTLVRNAVIMVLARLPWSVLIGGLSLVIPICLLLFVPYGVLIAAVLYLLIGFGLTLFVQASYANSCFDRFLNPRIEGAEVNRGLRDPSLMDEDEEVTEEDIKNL